MLKRISKNAIPPFGVSFWAIAVELTHPPIGRRLGGGRTESSKATDLTRPHPNPPPDLKTPSPFGRGLGEGLGEGTGSLHSTALPLWGGTQSTALSLRTLCRPYGYLTGKGVLVNLVNVLLALLFVLSSTTTAFAIDADNVQVPPSNAGQPPVVDKKGGVDEMREWLNKRNLDRQQKGVSPSDSFNSVKKYAATAKPHAKQGRKHSKEALIVEGESPPSGPTLADQMAERGPDGRVRHRLVINPNGPDQLQVYSNSGFAAPTETDEDARKMERMTPRGKQAWLAGAYLRVPASYHSLKPKGWNHPKYGNR